MTTEEIKKLEGDFIEDHQRKCRQMLRSCRIQEDIIKAAEAEIKSLKAAFIASNRNLSDGHVYAIVFPNGDKGTIEIIGADVGLGVTNEFEILYEYRYTNRGPVARRRVYKISYATVIKSIIEDIAGIKPPPDANS